MTGTDPHLSLEELRDRANACELALQQVAAEMAAAVGTDVAVAILLAAAGSVAGQAGMPICHFRGMFDRMIQLGSQPRETLQ
jgi:hypothetical protein